MIDFSLNSTDLEKMDKGTMSDKMPTAEQQEIRLKIFQVLIAANVRIDSEFFPFLHQVYEWVYNNKMPATDEVKTVLY